LPDHQSSDQHRTCADRVRQGQKADASIAQKLVQGHSKEIQRNRENLIAIIEIICFLGRQGIAFRGHDESDDSKNRGNFLELTDLIGKYFPHLASQLDQTFKYTSPKIQQELIVLIAKEIIKKIVPDKDTPFSIIVDGTTDLSKLEQISFCLRYVTEQLDIQEHFLEFRDTGSSTAEALSELILQVIKDHGLSLKNLVGQG
jgi:hypothetical protein